MLCSVLVSALALCLFSASATNIKFGDCPEVPAMKSFDLSKYSGVWYEIEQPIQPFEGVKKCVTETWKNKGAVSRILRRAIKESTGEEITSEDTAVVSDTDPGVLEIRKQDMQIVNYVKVLDTDYENYSVLYTCFNVMQMFNAENVWIMSRQKTLDDETKSSIYKILHNNKIETDELIPTEQDC